MTTGLLLRETVVSLVINVVLSIGFFLLVFGLARPVPLGAMAFDMLPQTFMIALMGAMVPSLILRRRAGVAARPIVIRSVLAALVALLVIGGGACLFCLSQAGLVLPATRALALRAAYGAALALLVTPLALWALLRSTRPE